MYGVCPCGFDPNAGRPQGSSCSVTIHLSLSLSLSLSWVAPHLPSRTEADVCCFCVCLCLNRMGLTLSQPGSWGGSVGSESFLDFFFPFPFFPIALKGPPPSRLRFSAARPGRPTRNQFSSQTFHSKISASDVTIFQVFRFSGGERRKRRKRPTCGTSGRSRWRRSWSAPASWRSRASSGSGGAH